MADNKYTTPARRETARAIPNPGFAGEPVGTFMSSCFSPIRDFSWAIPTTCPPRVSGFGRAHHRGAAISSTANPRQKMKSADPSWTFSIFNPNQVARPGAPRQSSSIRAPMSRGRMRARSLTAPPAPALMRPQEGRRKPRAWGGAPQLQDTRHRRLSPSLGPARP